VNVASVHCASTVTAMLICR